MSAVDGADALARSIVDVATGAGLRTTAFLTDMNEALGRTAGNALEVAETIGWLTGTFSDARLDEVVYTLGAEMLVLGGLAPDTTTAAAPPSQLAEHISWSTPAATCRGRPSPFRCTRRYRDW